MTAFTGLKDWNAGDSNRSRAHLQEPVDALRQLQGVAAVAVVGGPDTSPVPVEMGLAKIVNAGPAGVHTPAQDGDEPDFTDARYWIQRQLILFGDADDPVKVDTDTTDQIGYDSPPNIFVATNYPERNAGSHMLFTDGTVEVMYFGVYDAASPQQKHYLFYSAPLGDYTVYIDTAITGTNNGGKYHGYCWRAYPAANGFFFSPTVQPYATPCEIWVDDEINSNTISLQSQQHWSHGYGTGRFTGEYNSDTPPKPIIHAGGFAANIGLLAFVGFGTSGQIWQRDRPYADLSNPANTVTGDQPILIPICTSQDAVTKVCAFGSISIDASGRAFQVQYR